MRTKEDIENDIKRLARRGWLIGFVTGLLVGVVGGYAIAHMTIEQVVVIPLQEGVKI